MPPTYIFRGKDSTLRYFCKLVADKMIRGIADGNFQISNVVPLYRNVSGANYFIIAAVSVSCTVVSCMVIDGNDTLRRQSASCYQ